MKYKYLIIGNSAGAIGAVEGIREIDKENPIAIISDEKYQAYSRPLITHYLFEEDFEDKMFIRPHSFYSENNVTTYLGIKVKLLNLKNKKVVTENNEEIEFEKLLLATGGKPIIPNHEWLNKNAVFTLTKFDDSKKIKNYISILRKKQKKGSKISAVILGGGLIGLKGAEALINCDLEVTIVELADRCLSPVLDENASHIVENEFKNHGANIITNDTIKKIISSSSLAGKSKISLNQSFKKGNTKGLKVILKSGKKIECDIVILAIGVVPQVELVKNTEIEINRGIIVNKNLKTNVDFVYACGDAAEVYDFIMESNRLLPLWPNAYYSGRIAGKNMAGEKEEYQWATNMNSTEFWGYPIVSAGLLNAPDESNYETLIKEEDFNLPLILKTQFQNIENKIIQRKTYKKVIIKDNKLKGMILLNKIDKAGILLGLMRDKIDITSFKDKLLEDDFGLIYLPEDIRKEKLLK